MINIIYAALTMRAHTEKTTFLCKGNQCKALHINMGLGADKLVQISEEDFKKKDEPTKKKFRFLGSQGLQKA